MQALWQELWPWLVAVGAGYMLSVVIGHFALGWFHAFARDTLIKDMRAAADRRRQPDPFLDDEDTRPTATSSITGCVERVIFMPIAVIWPEQAVTAMGVWLGAKKNGRNVGTRRLAFGAECNMG